MPGLHSRTHPEPIDGCWACRVSTIRVDRGGARVIAFTAQSTIMNSTATIVFNFGSDA